MRWDTVPGKNSEGYPDPTASTALANVYRSQKGLQSKRAGEYFESMIAASLGWYRDKGVAYVEKTPEPMRPLRPPNRQGQFLTCYTKAGQPDFKGTLTGGRAVVFEAKHTDGDRIEQSRLTDEQVASLTEHHRLGAAAFIMVSFGLQDFYRVPWEVWRDMKKIYGRKHMKKAELEPYRVQYIAGVIKLLEGIELSTEAPELPEEVMTLIEEVLDTLVEAGNGVTNKDLHNAADRLFRVRDVLEGMEPGQKKKGANT